MEAPKILKWERKIRISLVILFFIVSMINIIGSDAMGLGDYAENQFIIIRNRQIRNFIFNFQALAFLNIIIVGLILYFNVDEIMDKWILWSLFALINGIYLGIIEHHYKKSSTVSTTNHTYE